jgi:hypothetical protein
MVQLQVTNDTIIQIKKMTEAIVPETRIEQ